MALTQKETDRLLVANLAALARRHQQIGVRLNHPEAVALLTDAIFEHARLGHTLPEVVTHASALLTTDDVLEGVAEMIPLLHVDALLADGARLVTVRNPIRQPQGAAPLAEERLIPGEIISATEDVIINADLPVTTIAITNTSELPVHLTAHMHIFEANPRLSFDRLRAWGMRLDVPATGSVRIPPGETVGADLVPIGGRRAVYGFNGAVNGELDALDAQTALAGLMERGFLHAPTAGTPTNES